MLYSMLPKYDKCARNQPLSLYIYNAIYMCHVTIAWKVTFSISGDSPYIFQRLSQAIAHRTKRKRDILIKGEKAFNAYINVRSDIDFRYFKVKSFLRLRSRELGAMARNP